MCYIMRPRVNCDNIRTAWEEIDVYEVLLCEEAVL